MNYLERIRKHYRIPAKRGMKVEAPKWFTGTITSASRQGFYLNVRGDDGKRYTVHPYELNYLSGDSWVIGKEEQKKYDAAWDKWNAKH